MPLVTEASSFPIWVLIIVVALGAALVIIGRARRRKL